MYIPARCASREQAATHNPRREGCVRITGRPAELRLDKVRAAFHYVRTGRTVAPDDLPGAEALDHLVRTAGAEDAGSRGPADSPDEKTVIDG